MKKSLIISLNILIVLTAFFECSKSNISTVNDGMFDKNCKILETNFTYSRGLINGLDGIVDLFEAKDSSVIKILRINLKDNDSYATAKMIALDKSDSIFLYESKNDVVIKKPLDKQALELWINKNQVETGSFHFFCGNNVVLSSTVVVIIRSLILMKCD